MEALWQARVQASPLVLIVARNGPRPVPATQVEGGEPWLVQNTVSTNCEG